MKKKKLADYKYYHNTIKASALALLLRTVQKCVFQEFNISGEIILLDENRGDRRSRESEMQIHFKRYSLAKM